MYSVLGATGDAKFIDLRSLLMSNGLLSSCIDTIVLYIKDRHFNAKKVRQT